MNHRTAVFLVLFFSFAIIFASNTYGLIPCLNDYYGVIYDSGRISGLCEEIEQETGVQFVVVLANFSGEIDEYALRLFDDAKIGEKNRDTGLLIVINPEDNNWIILVGYGLEGVLNDAKLGDIGRTYLEPSIDEGNYDDGVYYTLGIIGSIIYDSGEFHKEKGFWKDNWRIILAILILILIAFITKGKILFLPSIGKGFGGGRTGGGRAKR